MTKQEKIDQINELLPLTGNTTKLVRYFLLQALDNVPEDKIDEILAVLNG